MIALSLTTDFVTDTGSPEPALRAMANAGFTHLHWCHQWCTDFLYGPSEIAAIHRWLQDYHLTLNDVHGSAGREKNWGSTLEHERLAGIELIQNRIDFCAALGTDVLVMHAPKEPCDPGQEADRQAYWHRFRQTLDHLRPYAQARGVRLALENMPSDNFPTLRQVFADYPPDYIGLCYDCGHGNIPGNGLDQLDLCKDRLIATHLHDNDGQGDLHWPLFRGTVDWPRLAQIIASSAYTKPAASIESNLNHIADKDEPRFLAEVKAGGERFTQMLKTGAGG